MKGLRAYIARFTSEKIRPYNISAATGSGQRNHSRIQPLIAAILKPSTADPRLWRSRLLLRNE